MPKGDHDLYRHYVAFMSTLVLIALGGMAVAVLIAVNANRRTVKQERTIEIIEGQYGDIKRENAELRGRIEAMEANVEQAHNEAHQCLEDGSEVDDDQDEKIYDLESDVEMMLDGLKDSAWKDPHRC